ncbi:kinase-like protein [Dentipellis sp. KUC8613]|nr:kinase-like protein [Dentipellis sp. KUC8613]
MLRVFSGLHSRTAEGPSEKEEPRARTPPGIPMHLFSDTVWGGLDAHSDATHERRTAFASTSGEASPSRSPVLSDHSSSAFCSAFGDLKHVLMPWTTRRKKELETNAAPPGPGPYPIPMPSISTLSSYRQQSSVSPPPSSEPVSSIPFPNGTGESVGRGQEAGVQTTLRSRTRNHALYDVYLSILGIDPSSGGLGAFGHAEGASDAAEGMDSSSPEPPWPELDEYKPSSDSHTFSDAIQFGYGSTPVELSDGRIRYVLCGSLGRGSYGAVLLARAVPYDSTLQHPSLVAIKAFSKAEMRRYKSTYDAVAFEVEAMKRTTVLQAECVVHMLSCFQDEQHVYIVMRLYGKDLFHRALDIRRRMPVREITHYAAELLVGIENVHKLGIIHRDIKPENVFLTPNGHLALADFSIGEFPEIPKGGSFKDGKLYDLVGTECRYAPEQVVKTCEKNGYNYKVDIWAYGILLLELFIGGGEAYFKDTNGDAGVNEILNKDIATDIAWFVDTDAGKDLLTRLTSRDPAKRPTIKQIKDHPFFFGIDWELVAQGKYPPLHLPTRPEMDGKVAFTFPEMGLKEKKVSFEFDESLFDWKCPPRFLVEDYDTFGLWDAEGRTVMGPRVMAGDEPVERVRLVKTDPARY